MSNHPFDPPYIEELMRWRASLDQSLRKERSWLALAGLIWLEKPGTSFGSGRTRDIFLHGIAANAGEFQRGVDGVTLTVRSDSNVLVNGEHHSRVLLRSDRQEDPHEITVGPYVMMLIERGGRLGIRLWDNQRPARKAFPGRRWFPVNPDLRIQAVFTPYESESPILIPNELGEVEESISPGFVSFELGGESCRLDALEEQTGGLFLIFKDTSAGIDTYGSGRFLVTPVPEGDHVELDFNRAHNPPCAFTRYATCPLPPPQNFLPIRIDAGEKMPTG